MAKLIELTKGFVAIVDDEDYEALSKFSWSAHYSGKDRVYARRREGHGGPAFYMHRQIMGVSGRVDHRDGNGLNNQRSNLRPCTQSQNLQNARKKSGSSCKYKGVYHYKSRNQWMAKLHKDGKSIFLGYHPTPEAAAIAYNIEAKIQFGEFARVNEVIRG
jgi:hypothetical protein